ncbi:MAG TPA: hypothetical protein VL443_24135 [Cyclobacteriaceae bacterium]|jgi:hypothetical protein|nr:hypothetical protein [Cyclobacteriaceae bacterium]
MSEISKSAMKLLMDDDFIDKRIQEQKDYLEELRVKYLWSRSEKWVRYLELRDSATERLKWFEELKKYKAEQNDKKRTSADHAHGGV